MTTEERSAFLTDTLHRIMCEAARIWVIEHHQRTGELPASEARFAYANGPHGFDWGNAPGPDVPPGSRPLRGKRVRITFEIEEF